MKKRVIGITGSFGSGKTTVANMFKSKMKNCIVLDADRLAKKAYKNRRISGRIKKEFNTTDKRKIARIVFNEPEKLDRLNRIIHPLVIAEVKGEIKKEIKKHRHDVIVLDVPLLFETGMQKICDLAVLVKCRREIQIKRLAIRGFSKDETLQRIRAQMPVGKKAKLASYIIDNSRSLCDTESQVIKFIAKVFV